MRSSLLGRLLAVSSALLISNFAACVQAAEPLKGSEQLSSSRPIKTLQDTRTLQTGDLVLVVCPDCKTVSYAIEDKTKQSGSKPWLQTKNGQEEVRTTCEKCGSEKAFCCAISKSDLTKTSRSKNSQ